MAKFLQKAIESAGKNMKPAYPMMAVAVTNGIFKPLTTLTDKKEAPETKKYTALREVLTEVVAVPTYLTSNLIAEKGAELFYKNNPEKLKMAKGNIGFMGVCAAAVFVIPALCSVVVKPFTDMIFKKNTKNNAKIDVTPKTPITEVKGKKQISHAGNVVSYSNTFANNGGLRI